MAATPRPAVRAAVVYESMYGNTHAVAAAIALGIDPEGGVPVIPVRYATPDLVDGVDLVVVGGPTHAHSLTRPSTRKAAAQAAAKAGRQLAFDAPLEGPGLREWLGSLRRSGKQAAAFDTRIKAPAPFTGRAAVGIGRRLRHRGLDLICPPKSFFVTKGDSLYPGEEERAMEWGAELAAKAAARQERRDLEV